MAAAVYTVTAIIFLIFGNANLQPWGSVGASATSNGIQSNNLNSCYINSVNID